MCQLIKIFLSYIPLHTQQINTCSKSATETLEKGVKYILKLTLKTTRTGSLTIRTGSSFSSVSTFDSEQGNVCWVGTVLLCWNVMVLKIKDAISSACIRWNYGVKFLLQVHHPKGKSSSQVFHQNNCLEKFQKISMKISLKEINFSKSEG